MKDKITKIFKKLSVVTTHPDGDWMKICLLLFLILCISVGWNVYFYFSVKKDISISADAPVTKRVEFGKTAEEQIGAIVNMYDAKTAAHQKIIDGGVAGVADPASS